MGQKYTVTVDLRLTKYTTLITYHGQLLCFSTREDIHMTGSLRGQKPVLPVSSFHRLLRTKVKQIDPKKSGNRYNIVTEPQ